MGPGGMIVLSDAPSRDAEARLDAHVGNAVRVGRLLGLAYAGQSAGTCPSAGLTVEPVVEPSLESEKSGLPPGAPPHAPPSCARAARQSDHVGEPSHHVRQRRGRHPAVACSNRADPRRRSIASARPDRGDAVIDLDGAVVLPGLINAHDHLELNSFARLKWRERYANVREWIADFQPRFATDPALADGAARHARRSRLGRRPEEPAGGRHHGLPSQPAARAASAAGFRCASSASSASAIRCRSTATRVAEVVSPHAARLAVDRSRGRGRRRRGARARSTALATLGCLGREHGARPRRRAGPAHGRSRARRAAASLVWCPSSNDFLFGRTAAVRRFDDAGRLALGTDSRLSGEGDLLDELRAAHAHAAAQRSDRCVRAVTDRRRRRAAPAACRPAEPRCAGRPRDLRARRARDPVRLAGRRHASRCAPDDDRRRAARRRRDMSEVFRGAAASLCRVRAWTAGAPAGALDGAPCVAGSRSREPGLELEA